MNENARQDSSNGALPPIAYRIVAAELRGSKTRKKLEIDPLHADTLRLVYCLSLEESGTIGPMGVKTISHAPSTNGASSSVTAGAGTSRKSTPFSSARLGANHLEACLLQSGRLNPLFASVLDRRQARIERCREHLAETEQARHRDRPETEPALRRHRIRRGRSEGRRLERAHRRPHGDPRPSGGRLRTRPDRARQCGPSGCQPRHGPGLRPRGPPAHTAGRRRLPPRSPARPGPAESRSRKSRFASWDRSPNSCAPWSTPQPRNRGHLTFRVLY